MHNKYQNINIQIFRTQIKEVGEVARQNGDLDTFQQCAAEWKKLDEYENSLVAPWD